MTETTTANTETHPCPRCAGKGTIPQYSHRWHGLCLLCNGKGTRAGGARKPRARKAPKTGQNDATWAEFAAEFPGYAARILAGVAADILDAHNAYAAVYVYDRRDANFGLAITLAERLPRP